MYNWEKLLESKVYTLETVVRNNRDLVMGRKGRKVMSRAKSRCAVSEVTESFIFSFRLQGNSMDCDEGKPKTGQGRVC